VSVNICRYNCFIVLTKLLGEGNLRPHRPPHEYLGGYTSREKLKIPPADRILMDPGHKARKNLSDYADLGFQAVGPALRIMQLNVEGMSAAIRIREEEEVLPDMNRTPARCVCDT